MQISFKPNIIINRFDNKLPKQYNNFGKNITHPQMDYFKRTAKRLKVKNNFDTKAELHKFQHSEKMSMSPVSYLIPIVSSYLTDNKEEQQFVSELLTETRKMQFIFSHMRQSEILSNQRIFENEFKFADSVINATTNKTDSNTLKKTIQQAVSDYNNLN